MKLYGVGVNGSVYEYTPLTDKAMQERWEGFAYSETVMMTDEEYEAMLDHGFTLVTSINKTLDGIEERNK